MSEQRVNRISGHVVLGLSLFAMFLVVGATVLTMLGKFSPSAEGGACSAVRRLECEYEELVTSSCRERPPTSS